MAQRAWGWLGNPGPPRQVLGIALVVVAFLASVAMGFQYLHQKNVTACQVRFNNGYARVVQFRGELSDEDRAATVAFQQATGDLIHTVFHLPPSLGTARRTALILAAEARWERARSAYNSTERRISTDRRAHPLPVLPSSACR